MSGYDFPSRIWREQEIRKEIEHNAQEYTKVVSFMIVFMFIFNMILILSLGNFIIVSDAVKFSLVISDVFFAFASLAVLLWLLVLDYKYDKSLNKENHYYTIGKLHGQNVDKYYN